jgi:hypothetical protein
MHDQRRFDAIAREVTRKFPAVPMLLLDCNLRIRTASTAYERVTFRKHGELLGQFLFDAFPDDPNDPQASGTAKLATSLETAMHSGHTHNMWIQRYDIRDPAIPDKFLPKVWSPTNSPLFDHGELVGVVHRVEEISDSRRALAVLARAVDTGDSWTCAELLHTLAAVSAVENARHSERQQALVAEKRATAARHRHPRHDRPGQGHADGAFRCRRGGGIRPVGEAVAEIERPTGAHCQEAGRNRPSKHVIAQLVTGPAGGQQLRNRTNP